MTNKITIQNKLKFILSKYSIHNFEPLFKNFSLDKSHISFINKSVHNFLACRDIDKGYILYKCNSCGHSHKIALSCKSRLCPTCGFKYSATWTENISKDIISMSDIFCNNGHYFLPLHILNATLHILNTI